MKKQVFWVFYGFPIILCLGGFLFTMNAAFLIIMLVFVLPLLTGRKKTPADRESFSQSNNAIQKEVIRCPWCGSPVKVRGNRWECGWCGDSGGIASLHPSERAKLSRSTDTDRPYTLTHSAAETDAAEDEDEDLPKHFSRSELEKMVRQWDLNENEWACRDLLIASFPEAVSSWTAEELNQMDTMDLLLEVGQRDPATALEMVKLLLNTAEAHLQNSDVAEQLLGWDMYDLLSEDFMLPLLVDELKLDDRLARQLFQSAYVDRPQEAILNACGRLGEKELQQKLLELLAHNSFPHDEPELEELEIEDIPKYSHSARKEYQVKNVDDSTVYHYCMIQVENTHRFFAYLTGGLSVKIGDTVEVPFGKENLIRLGQVVSLQEYTRASAPWPPERTKTILKIVSAENEDAAKRESTE